LKRTFITNLVFLLFLNLLIKPFWIFGIDRTVQNTVGAEDYGLYFSLLSFSFLFNILLDFGITSFNNRSIAQDSSVMPDHLSFILPIKFMLSVVYAVVCLAAGLILDYSRHQFSILILLIINNFLLSMILYLRSNISGLHYFRTDSILSVLDRIFMIIFCSILLWGKITESPFRIEWFIYVQTISYVLTALASLVMVLQYSGKIKPAFRSSRIKGILLQSYPFALLILLMSLFNRMDSVMIERILPDGKEQTGIYAQSFRILDAVSMFAFLFAGLLLPIFSKMIKQNKPVRQLLELSASLLMIPALTLVIISLFYGSEIIALLYNEHLEISSRIYPRLISSFLFISITYIFGTLLTANGNLRELNSFAATTVLLNVCLNLVLIPYYKAEGAAYANLTSQAFFALSQVIISMKIFKLHLHYRLIGKYFCFIILLIISGLLFKKLDIAWTYGFLLLIFLGIIGSWAFQILIPGSLYLIIKDDIHKAE